MLAMRSTIADLGLRGLWQRALPANSDRLYRLWVRENEPSRGVLQTQREWSRGRAQCFTLITFVAEQTGWRPQRTAASLQHQSYPEWEWILVAAENSHAVTGAR